MLTAIVGFLVIFTVVLLAIGMAWQFVESRRKKQVAGMLHTVTGDPDEQRETTILSNLEVKDVLARMLAKFNFTKTVESRIQQAGMDWTAKKLFLMMAVFGVVGGVLAAKSRASDLGGVAIVAGAGLFALLPYIYVARKRTKRMAMFEEQFPEALDFVARALRAGHAFSVSLEMLSEESVDPLAVEFRKVFNEQNLGASAESALKNLSHRVPMLDVRFFVSAVLLQKETGGNLNEILSRLAYVIRERFRLKGQVKAASAHGRITGTILTIMPCVLMILLFFIAPGYLAGMAADEDGRKMIAGALGGQLLGYFFIRRIINIKV